MQAEALRELQDLFSMAHSQPETDHASQLVTGSCQIQSLEKFQAAPNNKRVQYATASVDSFNDYITAQATLNTELYINPKTMTASGIIDMGKPDAPLWGHHNATFTARKTEAFTELKKICGSTQTQRNLAEFVEDWAHIIDAHASNKSKISVGNFVQAIRKVEINATASATHEEDDFSASKSAIASVEAKAKAGLTLPAGFIFTSPLFEEFAERSIHCRISVLTGESKPMFRVRIVALPDLEKSCSEELIDKIEAPDGINIYTGQIDLNY